LATSAAHLYYALNQVSDGLEELAYFPASYDDRYLHTGKEMFRIAKQQLLPRFKHQREVKNRNKN
jgi:molecular chaperone DnaJ